MTKRTKFTIIAIIISIVLSVVLFTTVKHGRSQANVIGGEGLLLLLPVITYIICKNITLSFEVFHTPKNEEFEMYDTRIVSEPHKLNEEESHLEIRWSSHTHAEDRTE